MAITRRTCSNHPDRPAIGLCVITRKAICAECSTRYEGVNYSREGLQILHERRAKEAAGGGSGFLAISAVLITPLLLAMYASYVFIFELLMDVLGSD